MRSAVLVLSLCAATVGVAATPALMPLPVSSVAGSGALLIGPTFSVAATGFSDARLQGAIDRFVARMARQEGMLLPVAKAIDAAHATLRVDCAAAGSPYPKVGDDESYTLDVTADGAVLKAPAVVGALHGLETFLQLLQPGPSGVEITAVHIEDRPRFPWRGLMIDSSRHFMPLEVIERNIEAMAAVKLNVFHWHLVDDHGFRAESKKYPRLQEFGSDGLFYTQEEMRHIVDFARDRGIRVVPEFDIPGHSTSWLAGYPELGSAPGPYDVERGFRGVEGTIDPTRDSTYTFLDAFIGEMTAIFPDPYFHIGGDEVSSRPWRVSDPIQDFAKEKNLEGNKAIQLYFNQRVEKILSKYKRVPVGWDEILDADLPAGTVIQSWRGAPSLAESARHGFGAILSWGYYLDHLSPASYHYGIDPLAGAAALLPPEAAARIMGGEACMWAELITSETVDSRVWPRMAAIAERYWSPKEVTDVDSMYSRMEAVSRLLEFTGLRHRANSEEMIGRLAGSGDAEPVRILADASEALGLGPRMARRNTTMTPLNRFVDSIPADSESVRQLELAARKVAADPGSAAEAAWLRARLATWQANDVRFQAVAEGNDSLTQLKPYSKDLAGLGAAGQRLLDMLAGTAPVDAAWMDQENTELTRLLNPRGGDAAVEVKMAGARPVKLLFDAATRRKP